MVKYQLYERIREILEAINAAAFSQYDDEAWTSVHGKLVRDLYIDTGNVISSIKSCFKL